MLSITKEKKGGNAEPAEGSIEQALQNIRNTIANNNAVEMGDVLELTEIVASGQPTRQLLTEGERLPHSEPHVAAPVEKEKSAESVMSPEVRAQSQDMLGQFLHKAAQNKGVVEGDLTLQEFATQTLNREISAWINKNLPDMVRSIIEQEIKTLISQSHDK